MLPPHRSGLRRKHRKWRALNRAGEGGRSQCVKGFIFRMTISLAIQVGTCLRVERDAAETTGVERTSLLTQPADGRALHVGLTPGLVREGGL